ncbi:MAG: extracellular solute-binding protein [Candidatus Binataceae bacterium]
MNAHSLRRTCVCALAVALWLASAISSARAAEETLTVAFAGSMGHVMNQVIGPAFGKLHHVEFRGVGQGSYALARLLISQQMRADVFVSVTPGPMKLVIESGLAREATPIASTEMVIAYSAKSRFARDFEAAARGAAQWHRILQAPGLRFGRTDPVTDPQGRNIIFSAILAAAYYGQPDLARKILGDYQNPAQIFAEPALLSRLEAGQLDAASSYRSNAESHHVPYVRLPDEVNLSNPKFAGSWYSRAEFSLPASNGDQHSLKPEPLVFYAAPLADAADSETAHKFVAYLAGADAQRMLRDSGYGPPSGSGLQ